MNKFQKHIDAYTCLISATKERVMHTLSERGTISFKPGKLTEVSFNSMSNGAVLYDIGAIYKDGEILCPEEDTKWKGVLNEDDHDDIICAYMGLNELSDYGWCQVADAINKYIDKSPYRFVREYHKIEKNIHLDIVKLSEPEIIVNLDKIDVYDQSGGDFYTRESPRMLSRHSIVFEDYDYVTLDNFILDDLITILKHVK